MRRFRESNLSCDHLRECLNELLGVGPGERETPRIFGNFYRRDILYGNAGPTGIRGEPKPHGGGYRRGKEEDLSPSSSLSLSFSFSFFREEARRRPESTYLPVGLLLNPRSRLMDSSSPRPMHAYLRHESTSTCISSLSPLRRLSHLAALLSICDFFLTFYASRDVSAAFVREIACLIITINNLEI